MSRRRAVGRLQGALATSRPRPEPDSLVAVRSDVHEPRVAMHDRFVDNRPGPTALVLVGKDLLAVAAQPARAMVVVEIPRGICGGRDGEHADDRGGRGNRADRALSEMAPARPA